MIDTKFIEKIAKRVSAAPEQVSAAVDLLDKGAAVPFVARYRKDLTGNLGEGKLEGIREANGDFIALVQRRDALLQGLEKDAKLTAELREALNACQDELELEDFYVCCKRKSRAQTVSARAAGLDALVDLLLKQESGGQAVEELSAGFVRPEAGIKSTEDALKGAVAILAERLCSKPDMRRQVRESLIREGRLSTFSTKLSEGKATKYKAYYEFAGNIDKIPPSKLGLIFRGEKEGMLRMEVSVDDEAVKRKLLVKVLQVSDSIFEPYLRAAIDEAYAHTLRPEAESDALTYLHEKADDNALRVVRSALRRLLMGPPAKGVAVIGAGGIDGERCVLALVDSTGAFREKAEIVLNGSEEALAGSGEILKKLAEQAKVGMIAVPGGAHAHKAAEQLQEILRGSKLERPVLVTVHPAGLAVYSTSASAAAEFPDESPVLRSAVSIARRLQDPLHELVKLEPRQIVGGQQAYGVNRKSLNMCLQQTVSACVDRVRVDVNRASVELLRYVAGIQGGAAENIVAYRNEHGSFSCLEDLNKVDGVGVNVFLQCAGFLRVEGGDNPLDATAIHPEAYPVVEKIAASVGVAAADLVGNNDLLEKVDWSSFEEGVVGKFSLADIRYVLSRRGRDPRGEYRLPKRIDRSLQEIREGELTEGVVTNVTDFGAFVNIGVGQDGLVHLSELANRFVSDPREIVYVGEVVKVKIVAVDTDRPRVSLSLKAAEPARAKRRGKPEPATAGVRVGNGEGDGAGEGKRRRGPRSKGGDAGRKPRKTNGEGRKPTQRPKKPAVADATPLNTQLADQLAALRDKFSA